MCETMMAFEKLCISPDCASPSRHDSKVQCTKGEVFFLYASTSLFGFRGIDTKLRRDS